MTDSLFLEAEPLIKKLYPNNDVTDNEHMSSAILKITHQVQDFLNGSFDIFCNKFLNITEGHRFNVKQEIIGRSSIFISKKRYAIWVINKNGVPKDEILYKGLDTVRSSFPFAFKGFLKDLLTNILKDKPRDEIDQMVVDFKNSIRMLTLDDISYPTSVKNISKYGTKRSDSSKIFGNWIKGSPCHVKASISYNEFIFYHKLQNKFALLFNNEKIKWVYLKNNPFGIEAIAIRGYNDPPEVYDFINTYIDKNKMFEHILKKKIEDFYNALGWEVPSAEAKTINTFFDF